MKPYMTLKTYIVLTSLALLLLPQLATAQGNFVFNGDFDTSAAGWMITNIFGSGYESTSGNPPGDVSLFGPVSPSTSPTASQTINGLIIGAIYNVSGDYREIGGKNSPTDNSFGVALDGVFLFETAAPADYKWYSFNFDYTATSTSALLSLEAQINGTDYAYAIDNISMEAVPEPSSLCLIGVGGIISTMFFRNRRKGLSHI